MVCVTLAAACFKELPTVPDGSSSSSSGTGEAPTSESGASSGSGAEVTSAASTASPSSPTTDEDPSTGTTAAPAPPLEGLFACKPELCDPWEPPACVGACGPPDAAGACLLGLMRDRVSDRGDVRVCEGTCTRTAFVIRGDGTDEVTRQTATEVGEGLTDYVDLRRCVLRDASFFEACIVELTDECVDPTKWVKSCADFKIPCGDG